MSPKFWCEVKSKTENDWKMLSKEQKQDEIKFMKIWSESRGHKKIPRYWFEFGHTEFEFRKLTEEEQEEAAFHHTQLVRASGTSFREDQEDYNGVPGDSQHNYIHDSTNLLQSPESHTISVHSSAIEDINVNSEIGLDSSDSESESTITQGNKRKSSSANPDNVPKKKARRGRPSKEDPAKRYTKPSDITSRCSRKQMLALSKSVARRSSQIQDVEVDIGGSNTFCSRVIMIEVLTIKDPPFTGGNYKKNYIRDRPLVRIIGGKDKNDVENIFKNCLNSLANTDSQECYESVLLHTEEDVEKYYREEMSKRRSESKVADSISNHPGQISRSNMAPLR